MTLIEKLVSGSSAGVEKLAIHSFISSLQELILGRKVRNDLIALHELDSVNDVPELDLLITKINARLPEQRLGYLFELWGVLILGEEGKMYATAGDVRVRLEL